MSTSRSPRGTLYLILIQVASRGLTFIGNQFLLRFLSPELLGIAVQLEIFSVSVLYFSRESIRVALQRQPALSTPPDKTDEKNVRLTRAAHGQGVVNVAYVAVFLGVSLTFLLGGFYLQNASQEVLNSPQFGTALRLYAVATIIEILAEPSFVIIQQSQLYRKRAASETSAAILKCISACLATLYNHRSGLEPSVMPFAVGQLTYSLTLLFSYLSTTIPVSKTLRCSLFLRPIASSSSYIFSRFSRPLISLSATLYAQSIFKQLLTQGDALLLSTLAPLSDQGAFALASNYGSLLARLVFQPIEESSRNTFGTLLSTQEIAIQSQPQPTNDDNNIDAGITYLDTILHTYSLLTLLSYSVAPSILPLAVRTLLGPRWFQPENNTTPLTTMLSTYTLLIPLLAYNGILDAFITSVASPSQLRTQALVTMVCTAVSAATAYICLRMLALGAVGLVVANAVGKAVQISWSAWYVRDWVERYQTDRNRRHPDEKMTSSENVGVWPHPATVVAAVVAAAMLQMNPFGDDGRQQRKVLGGVDVRELGQIVAASAFLGITILYFEREFIMKLVNPLLPQRLAATFESFSNRHDQMAKSGHPKRV